MAAVVPVTISQVGTPVISRQRSPQSVSGWTDIRVQPFRLDHVHEGADDLRHPLEGDGRFGGAEQGDRRVFFGEYELATGLFDGGVDAGGRGFSFRCEWSAAVAVFALT